MYLKHETSITFIPIIPTNQLVNALDSRCDSYPFDLAFNSHSLSCLLHFDTNYHDLSTSPRHNNYGVRVTYSQLLDIVFTVLKRYYVHSYSYVLKM